MCTHHPAQCFVPNIQPGVTKALSNVNDVIAPALVKSGLEVTAQKDIDDFLIKLDGTPNKAKLGANAIVGVSMAVAMAGAGEKGVPLYQHLADLAGVKPPYTLPVPGLNVINGGRHAGNRLAPQEFMLLPTGATSFHEAMKFATETYHTLKKVIGAKYGIDGERVHNLSHDHMLMCLSQLLTSATRAGLRRMCRRRTRRSSC